MRMGEKTRPTQDWSIEVYPFDMYGHMFKWQLLDDHDHVMAEGHCGDEQDAIEAADMNRRFYDEKLAKP